MILVIFGVMLILFLLILFLTDDNFNTLLPLFGLVISIIVIVCLTICVSRGATIDEKIEMYQDENTNIEAEMDILVKNYMQYENETLSNFTPDSSITLVSLYPDLKSDELVKTQIEVYVANNEKIKELKEDKININVYKWWLYFGGN